MKKILLILLLFAVGCTTKINQETTNYEDEQILVGIVNWDGLTQQPYDGWFTPNYLDYVVDAESLIALGASIDNIDVLMFMGTWCSDSHVQVPQFYKILDHFNYDISKMTVVALERLESRELVSPQHEEEDYNITHVPTFIFLKDGKELGRITEYPERTLEKDMVQILAQ